MRLTWNVWPNSRIEATKCVIPFASMYTPCKRLQNLMVSLRRQAGCPTSSTQGSNTIDGANNSLQFNDVGHRMCRRCL